MNKFLFSNLLKEFDPNVECQIINEQPFEVLSLANQTPPTDAIAFLDQAGFADKVSPKVKMLITTEELKDALTGNYGLVVCSNPRRVFFELQNFLVKEKKLCRETFKTKIGRDCKISSLSSIAENNVIIEDGVTIEEFVVIRENTYIGENTIIRSGVVIGGQGFEFKPLEDIMLSVEHSGGVIIGENVEIQYNSSIDRALYIWDDTVIGDDCKIDNLVHLSHGVKLGNRCLVVAQSGIGGRTVIGENVWIGLGATVKNAIEIGDMSRVNMGAVVSKDVPQKASVTGNFAIEHSKFMDHIKELSNK